MPKLTEAFMGSREPNGRDQRYYDSQVSGFEARVTPAGSKILLARAYVGGRRRSVTLGYFPKLSVADGRKLALQAIADMRRGADPVIERQERTKAATAGKTTVAALA
jgi:hypothetical protein